MKTCFKLAGLALLLTQLGLLGCAMSLPSAGVAKVIRHENFELAEADTLVTLGPVRLLDFLAKQIAATDPLLEPVDALLFRDTAFPQGGWRLQELLDKERRIVIVEQLNVAYLVLVTPLVYNVGGDSGFFIPLVAGAQVAEHKSSLSVTIYDLKSGTAICRIDASATGKERVFSYVLIFTGTTPHLVTPMLDALVKEVVSTISKANPERQVRIAVLAAEVPKQQH